MDQIFDIFAVRVIVDTVSDCYNVLGVVHDIFKPIPNRFKDYISMPKPNMYQSLHTTVLDKNAIPFEIQIRTWEMHYTAEYGIAAHWKYKLGMGAGGKNNDKMEENIKKVKDMILDQLEAEDVTDIAKNIRNDFTENDVYVFSPRGDVFNLPQGSTPIDMAYLIHTQVGHRMVGAKINGKSFLLTISLKQAISVKLSPRKRSTQTGHGLISVKPHRQNQKSVHGTNMKSVMRILLKAGRCLTRNLSVTESIFPRKNIPIFSRN